MRSTMHISLPGPLKKWVQDQVEQKGFSTASEFVRDVLRQQQQQESRARVEEKLIEGLNSGPSKPMTKKDWQRIAYEGQKLARKLRKK